MPDQPNFLLGYGERLVEPVSVEPGGGPKSYAYTFDEAKKRIAPLAKKTSKALDRLPDAACPNDEAVGIITLHPQWLAKSYHPSTLLRAVGLETVGSRPKRVKPEKWTRKPPVEEAPSTELFVAGPRSAFRTWASDLPEWSPPAQSRTERPLQARSPSGSVKGRQSSEDSLARQRAHP